jgi:putative flavoprotein involved in K+ transport
MAALPGFPYSGSDPDGFMPREEITSRVAQYAEVIGAPVVVDAGVERITPIADGFRVETTQGEIRAGRIVVATGGFHVPKTPAVAGRLPARLTQLHSHAYRNEGVLPQGSVLVVGSGQSGVQLAEELADAGRDVYLTVGSAARLPRRYRGRDCFRWMYEILTRGAHYDVALPTVDTLPDPRIKLAGNPHLSGHMGGHDTNLRRMAADGMTLIGRIEAVDGERLRIAGDLSTNLAKADGFFDERVRPLIDSLIDRAGIDAPPDDREPVDFEPPERSELDLGEAGISTIIWATGYGRDYGWIDAPITDDMGLPRQRRGVTDIPGLYFLGSLWQYTQFSATLGGPAIDGRYLATEMGLPIPDEPFLAI